MNSSQRSRKWQLTINNPIEHGYPHEQIKRNLTELKTEYWCMCDEIGENGTLHTHIYIYSRNAISFSALKKRFEHAHIEKANGTSQQNYDYIRKEGAYLDSDKKETNLPDTFEEYGTMPVERKGQSSISTEVVQMVKDGASNAEIVAAFPSMFTKLHHLDDLRQTLRYEEQKDKWRDVKVTYIYGPSRTGKTRYVMEKYGYSNVYRVTNYKHPFDGYNGQKVLLLEDYHSNLPLQEFLDIAEGYPIQLRSRYQDKVACFVEVYIISNLPLEQQYVDEQLHDPATYEAFFKRIHEELIFPQAIMTDEEIFGSPSDNTEKGEVC